MLEPTYANVVSTIALIFSAGSFVVAAPNSFRDRPRLEVTSQFFAASEWGGGCLPRVGCEQGAASCNPSAARGLHQEW
jgi:hypothetical protein